MVDGEWDQSINRRRQKGNCIREKDVQSLQVVGDFAV
jgi:hypothetical protein